MTEGKHIQAEREVTSDGGFMLGFSEDTFQCCATSLDERGATSLVAVGGSPARATAPKLHHKPQRLGWHGM
jgi:hypothetical protein